MILIDLVTGLVMKVGDLVRITVTKYNGIIIDVDDSHRQTVVTVMTEHGHILKNLWSQHLEVISKV